MEEPKNDFMASSIGDDANAARSVVARSPNAEPSDAPCPRLAETEAVDLYQFTKLIKANYSLGQKMVLMEVMWGLVYADGQLSSHEESLLRKVCNLLDLSPGYLSDVKKRVEVRRDLADNDADQYGQEPD